MAVVARASASYSIRILIMAALCAVLAVWFTYDGWVTYPAGDDTIVKGMIDRPTQDIGNPIDMQTLKAWPGFYHANSGQIKDMGDLAKRAKIDSKWQTELDVLLQRSIAVGLYIGIGVTLYFFRRFTGKRAIADENGLSAAGVLIPWANIKKIDNTQWDKGGFVTITYADATGQDQNATLDSYDLDNLPAVLDVISDRATNAEFDPPLEAAEGKLEA